MVSETNEKKSQKKWFFFFQSWKKKQNVECSSSYFLLNQLGGLNKQLCDYVYDFWHQEFQQGWFVGFVRSGTQKRWLKRLRMIPMLKVGIIQRCLRLYVQRFILAVRWDLSWACWLDHHVLSPVWPLGLPHNVAARESTWGASTTKDQGRNWVASSDLALEVTVSPARHFFDYKEVKKVAQIQGKGVRPFCLIWQ